MSGITRKRALSPFYKFSALWGGQAGSLLFWCMILSAYGAVVAYVNRDRHRALMPYVNATLLTTSLFFLVLLVFAAIPSNAPALSLLMGRA